MSTINRQKFIAELVKLLTFMYEEDRETAIAMYQKMFDLVPDEKTLMRILVSPTRQAVLIARSYNANERKLSIQAEHGYEEAQVAGDEPAPFIETIRMIFSDVLDAIPDREEPAPPSQVPAPGAEDSFPEEDYPYTAPYNLPENTIRPSYSDTVTPRFVQPSEGTVLREWNESSQESKRVDSFLKGFSVEETATVEEDKKPVQTGTVENHPEESNSAEDDGKLSGGALVLFLLIAIPLTALGLILVFAVALGFLAIAVCGFIMGFRIVEAAFGSFKVFADVLVVTGTGFVVLALALLALWTAIWLLIGVTSKMVNGIINLAIKICTKKEKTDG